MDMTRRFDFALAVVMFGFVYIVVRRLKMVSIVHTMSDLLRVTEISE